jgi:hypothetical protein
MPIVDRFEAANPPVRETLRTARDTVARGDDNMMARRLYAEAADRLREASSVELLDTRRLGATIALTLLLGVASVHALGAGVQLFGAGPSTGPAGSGGAAEYEGLRSADEVLGEETNVSELDEDLDATVGTSGGGDEETNRTIPRRSYGGGTAGSFDAARAGFEETESVEDAALIREYNLRIRGETS